MSLNEKSASVLETPGLHIEQFQTLAVLGPDCGIFPPSKDGEDRWTVYEGMDKRGRILAIRFNDPDRQPDAAFVRALIEAMSFAYHCGADDGEAEIKNATGFALRTLLGGGDWRVLQEAAAEEDAAEGRKRNPSD